MKTPSFIKRIFGKKEEVEPKKEDFLQKIHSMDDTELTTTNTSFLLKYKEEWGCIKDLHNAVNYINSVKWLLDRNFAFRTLSESAGSKYETRIHSFCGGIVSVKTPWSETPLEYFVGLEVNRKPYGGNSENMDVLWRAHTCVSCLFLHANGREDLKDSPLCDRRIRNIFAKDGKNEQYEDYGYIVSEFHHTPQEAMLFVFRQVDKLLKRIESLSSFEEKYENALKEKEKALDEFGFRQMKYKPYEDDRYNDKYGWREKEVGNEQVQN